MSTRTRGLLAAVITAFCWAILALMLKISLQFADAATIAFYRLAVATTLVLAYVVARRIPVAEHFKMAPWRATIAAILLGLNYWGFMEGVARASPSQAQIMIQIGPLLLTLFGVTIFKEKLTIRQIGGIVLTVCGLTLFYADQMALTKEVLNFHWGNAWLVMAAVTWAIFAALQKAFPKPWGPATSNLFLFFGAACVLIPVTNYQVISNLTFEGHFWLTLCGLNTIVSYGFLSVALKNLPASQASVIITTNPLLTISLMLMLTHFGASWIDPDRYGTMGLFGAVAVVAGVTLVVLRTKKRHKERQPLPE